ncbi:MAG TPA: anti-sigma factor [Terriglobales bacterium]|nr:anti-sigma factor [Terriglobales bacterium]
MKCAQAKSLFSPYLDGAVTGTQMRALSQHLESCDDCHSDYSLLQQSQQLLARAGRRKAPADLELRLRLAISREVAHKRAPYLQGAMLRLENLFQAFMVPATAGLIAAVAIFGLVMGLTTMPLQAADNDVPLMLYTAPQLQQAAFGTTLESINDDSLVIEAYVDSNGRIQDYRILSDSKTSSDLLPQVKNMLIFTTFRPATAMGRPTSGRAVLSFSKINVHG